MQFNILFYLALLVFAGLACGRLVKLVKLPNVTGYLIAGLLLGPSVFNIINAETLTGLEIIPEVALGFIAFSIGSEFKASYFKRVGITPVVIAITEALGAVFFVAVALILAGNELSFSIVLGSIAAATAPAATIMVIKQYKAKGPVTETLLSVVALDDAVALIGFGFAVAIAQSITSSANNSMLMSILNPFIEIITALAIGGLLGVLFIFPLKWFKKDSNRLCIIIGFVFLTIALADFTGSSALLACMALGAVVANLCKQSDSIMKISDYITPPIFVMFFAVSGAELDLSVLKTVGLVGIVYIIFRIVGKLAGAWFGAKIMKSPKEVQKYLGPTLIPQAGVAIGLSLVAESVVPDYASVIRTVVLCGTLIYEIIGPVLTKLALTKAGEIKPAPKAETPKA